MTKERQEIIDLLKDSHKPLSPKNIAEALGKKSGNIRKLLHQLIKTGEIINIEYGKYAVSGNTSGNTFSNGNASECPGRDNCNTENYILKEIPKWLTPGRWCIKFDEWCREGA